MRWVRPRPWIAWVGPPARFQQIVDAARGVGATEIGVVAAPGAAGHREHQDALAAVHEGGGLGEVGRGGTGAQRQALAPGVRNLEHPARASGDLGDGIVSEAVDDLVERRLYSRMQLVQIFPRESQEMVFEAHERAFHFFGGVCRRGIYDNMKTAVSMVFVGKERAYNRRFLELCSHHLVEPVACTPGAGWEKGQVERQVGDVRGRLFVPIPQGRSYVEINEWLMDRCIEDAKKRPHPTIESKTVWQVFEEERPFLMAYRGPFDGFHATEVAVSKTCLVRFDNNHYSVAARAVGRPVDVRAYADRIVIRQDGETVAEHPRSFGRGEIAYDPWHYVPILTRKPGALRNGAPFKGWQLPGALGRIRARLTDCDDGDRQFVRILAAVQEDGLEAVEAACAEALDCGACSADVVLNILARQCQPAPPATIPTPEGLQLRHRPVADCQRYDRLREAGHGAS